MGSTLDAFIGGRSRSVVTLDLGPVTVAGVKLDPRALRWLIGTSLIEFGDATLTLRDLQRATLLELEDVSAHAASREAGAAEAVAQQLSPAGQRQDGPPGRALDQSHFNREFRAFSGAPPTARLAATLRHGTSISEHLLAGELSVDNAAGARP